MRIEITDRSGGLMCIRLAEGKIVGTKEIAPGVILDYTADKQIMGIEVLYLDRPGMREAPDLSLKTFLGSIEDGERKVV